MILHSWFSEETLGVIGIHQRECILLVVSVWGSVYTCMWIDCVCITGVIVYIHVWGCWCIYMYGVVLCIYVHVCGLVAYVYWGLFVYILVHVPEKLF